MQYTIRWWFNLPPGPIGFPIIGSIPYFEKYAEKTFASWTKRYGPIIMVDIGSTRNVVLNSYEAIEEVNIHFSVECRYIFNYSIVSSITILQELLT